MPSLFDTLHKDTPNPLKNIEDILTANDWDFNRLSDTELLVSLAGKYCDYRLAFIWQADMKAIQITVQYDLTITPLNLGKAAKALMTLNEQTWLGHFEIPGESCTPHFRYNCLFHNTDKKAYGDLEHIIDIALAQCENNFAAFSILSADTAANDETLPLALMPVQGAS